MRHIQAVKRNSNEPTPEWRARYKAAYAPVFDELWVLPALEFDDKAQLPEMIGDPNILRIARRDDDRVTHYRIPEFQLRDGELIDLVRTINFQLQMELRTGPVPWGHPSVAILLWWTEMHPKFGVAPITMLGSSREQELTEEANALLRGRR